MNEPYQDAINKAFRWMIMRPRTRDEKADYLRALGDQDTAFRVVAIMHEDYHMVSMDVFEDVAQNFKGYDEPIGTIITLHPAETARTRLARAFFSKQLFLYFEQLVSGQTGWGISFTGWLETYGWKIKGLHTFERVEPVFPEKP